MPALLTQYQSIQDDTQRSQFFEDYLYQPFLRLCEANLNYHKTNEHTHSSEQDIIQDLITHCVTKIYHFDAAKGDSFGYFNRVARNQLFLTNQKSYRHSKRYLSIEGIIDGYEEDMDMLMLMAEPNKPSLFPEEAVSEIKSYWRNEDNFNQHFAAKYRYHTIGKVFIDCLLNDNYPQLSENSVKITFFKHIKDIHIQQYGYSPSQSYYSKSFQVIRKANRELYKDWLNRCLT